MEKNILFENQQLRDRESKDLERVQRRIGSFGKPIKLGWPTDYRVITQPFGANPELHFAWNLPGHEGLDIRAPRDSKVYASADGVVETIHMQVDDDNPYGRYLIIQHSDGYRTLYGHLGSVAVSTGQKVKSGVVIAKAAPTGLTTGGHIHLSLTQKGATAAGLTQFPDDIIDPTPFLSFSPKQPELSSYPWPIGHCLAGIWANDEDLAIDAPSNYLPEAALLRMNASKEQIKQLRRNNPTLFLLTQLELPKTRKPISTMEWVAWAKPRLEIHISVGVGYFAILRTPNLIGHGYGLHWSSGEEFGRWWLEAVSLLKASFPSAKFGFPSLAPGSQITGQRMDASIFMEGADEDMLEADWIGAICNWNNPKDMLDEDKGGYYQVLRRYFPKQLLFITEFGSSNPDLDPAARASEATRYLETLADQAGIGAAFTRI
jgi:murein DD-endopeptidase MepM/ murein hydrolase activator NlpD